MTVKARTLVIDGDVGQIVGRLDGEDLEHVHRALPSVEADQFVRLVPQPTAWVCEAVFNGPPRVALTLWPVHWLKKKVSETEILKTRRLCTFLRKDQLEFVSGTEHESGISLGTHAHPVDAVQG